MGSCSLKVLWFGPVMKEPVSGVILNGESALLLFFKSVGFEHFVLQQCRTFEHFHHAPVDDREDDSIRPSHCLTSEPGTIFLKDECPTPKLMSKLLKFVEQVLDVDEAATVRSGEKFRSIPSLFPELFQAFLSIIFDTADKHSRSIMSELASDVGDYSEMFESVSNFVRRCLETHGSNSFKAVVDNNATSQSMLISSVHHLSTIRKDPKLVRMISMKVGSIEQR